MTSSKRRSPTTLTELLHRTQQGRSRSSSKSVAKAPLPRHPISSGRRRLSSTSLLLHTPTPPTQDPASTLAACAPHKIPLPLPTPPGALHRRANPAPLSRPNPATPQAKLTHPKTTSHSSTAPHPPRPKTISGLQYACS
ncbi:hypothetical protein BV22DRAFT_1135985 [Leucogyrophana mollusca]|uniref:Uncharacterized protein n=1 Tax=Leucogyrophana mollusca TaxID=85980 RepID=A0ACB8AV64_9AGAM|nr:hypothetical protein BV22DRAFT_1135985 [Leucogyrophana mollusca]